VNKRAGLAACAMHGQGMANGGLHQEPVQNCAIVAIIIETIDQALIKTGLVCLCAPYDALVQVRDPHRSFLA
jgi:hypothetical protein